MGPLGEACSLCAATAGNDLCVPSKTVLLLGVQGGGACAVADTGGSIITGIDGNPLAVLVKQMRLHLADIRSGACMWQPR